MNSIKNRFTNEIILEFDENISLKQICEEKKDNLRWANLRWADLCEANLCVANLKNITMNWNSHNLIAQILLNHSKKDYKKRMIAGLIKVSEDWCWKDFENLKINKQLRNWAIGVLKNYIKEGDEVPDLLK